MGIFKYIPKGVVVSFAKQLPSFAETAILKSKYKDLLAQQFLEAMRNPQSEKDKQMRKRAKAIFDRKMRQSDKAPPSKIENRIIFWKSLQGYARDFAEEYVGHHPHSSTELKSKILGTSHQKEIAKNPLSTTPSKDVQQQSTNEQVAPEVTPKRILTREEIIKQNYPIEKFKKDIELEFQATYVEKTGLKNNRQVMEERWRTGAQSATSPFMKIYNEELLKKVELFKARQRLQKQKKKTKEREQDYDLDR